MKQASKQTKNSSTTGSYKVLKSKETAIHINEMINEKNESTFAFLSIVCLVLL